MKAIKDIYRIGYGPSSSHTIGPMRIVKLYKEVFPESEKYIVNLYGSLAFSGKGHKTDLIIKRCLGDNCKINFVKDFSGDTANKMTIEGFSLEKRFPLWHGESLGGGAIRIAEYPTDDDKEVYEENTFEKIKDHLLKHDLSLLDYIRENESDLEVYLDDVLKAMFESVKRGLNAEGIISDRLKVSRSAKKLYEEAFNKDDEDLKLIAYAYAASEENAMGEIVATAPTLGSCGIVASLMYYAHFDKKIKIAKLKEALMVGGIFGNLVKTNASIAGAIGGCQAEVGTACAMAAAMIAYLKGGTLDMIEYAAEIGIEHHLGLTCDPVFGMVIIPCIERNAMAVLRSFDAAKLSMNLLKFRKHLVTFDMVTHSMNYTGQKLSPELKETSLGGLALEFSDEED